MAKSFESESVVDGFSTGYQHIKKQTREMSIIALAQGRAVLIFLKQLWLD